MRTHLRRDQADVLSSQQGDENIEFLSRVTILAANSQIYTGGVYYQPGGNYTHVLPSVGSTFTITIAAGTATLAGRVGETVNPIYGPGPERRFFRHGGIWHEEPEPPNDSGPAPTTGRALFVVRSLSGQLGDAPLTWMLNGAPAQIVLPLTATEGERFGIVRGNGPVSVVVSGGGTIVGVDATGQIVRRQEAKLGRAHRLATFTRLAGDWRALVG